MVDNGGPDTPIAQFGSQSPSVYTGDRGQPEAFQPGIQGLCRTPVGGRRQVRPHDAPAGDRSPRFHILRIRPDDADVRKGKSDDLPGIGRIGEDLLVARDRSIKTDLADSRADRSRAPSPEDRPIGRQ